MNDRERQEALEEAVRSAVATHATRSAPPRAAATAQPPAWRVAVILAGWALIGWIWLAEPAVFFAPTVGAEVPADVREARLRFAMYLHHQDIVAFTQDSGRVPGSLAELEMDAADGVRLAFDAQSAWSLVGTDGDHTLHLTAAMSADSFLGTSIATLEGAR